MKKILLSLIVLAAINFSVVAQSNFYPTGEYVAVVTADIPVASLPALISKTVNVRFDKDNPLTWSKLPYKLNDFGWVYEVGTPEERLARYEVSMKTTRGGFFKGFYNEEGELVETIERSKDITVPRYIMEALLSGPYKDWTVVGNKEVVNFFQNSDNPKAVQKVKLVIEKDKVKRTLAFNYEAGSGELQARLIK